MNTNQTCRPTPRPLALTFVLLLAPALTVLALVGSVRTGTLTAISEDVWVGGALLLWSPLPFSLPAVLLERERDAALPTMPTVARAVALVPWMMTSPQSTARLPMVASVAGFAIAAVVGVTL